MFRVCVGFCSEVVRSLPGLPCLRKYSACPAEVFRIRACRGAFVCFDRPFVCTRLFTGSAMFSLSRLAVLALIAINQISCSRLLRVFSVSRPGVRSCGSLVRFLCVAPSLTRSAQGSRLPSPDTCRTADRVQFRGTVQPSHILPRRKKAFYFLTKIRKNCIPPFSAF